MQSKFKPFLWPDHVIGKRESKRIRDEHNALYNSHAELIEVCEEIAALNKGQGQVNLAMVANKAEAMLKKIKENCDNA